MGVCLSGTLYWLSLCSVNLRREWYKLCRPGGQRSSGVVNWAAKASRKQSSLSGKESAQGCIPKRLLGRPD